MKHENTPTKRNITLNGDCLQKSHLEVVVVVAVAILTSRLMIKLCHKVYYKTLQNVLVIQQVMLILSPATYHLAQIKMYK